MPAPVVSLTPHYDPTASKADLVPMNERVFFFDIDNTLYPESSTVSHHMAERIRLYCINECGIPASEAGALGARYYKDYGLAIRGLLKHHQVDARHYDAFVDGGLPLEQLIGPTPALKDMLKRIKTRRWAFTNAGMYEKNSSLFLMISSQHASRVLNILEIDDLFEGITFCDYAEPNFPSKPNPEAYLKAMREAGVTDHAACYLIDDSAGNVMQARQLGWRAVHVVEKPVDHGHDKTTGDVWREWQVRRVEELEFVLPSLFDKV